MKRVLVFGVFDGLHEGHQHILNEARRYGDYLIVALALDETVRSLKKKDPFYTFEDRKKHLLSHDSVDEVIAGDQTLLSWHSLKDANPDVVAIGWDQDKLKDALREHLDATGLSIKIETIQHLPRGQH